MSEKIRYRIKGKTYYKLSEEPLKEEDLTFAEGIWKMSNPKGEEFRLLISKGQRYFTLYSADGRTRILKTTSISRIIK